MYVFRFFSAMPVTGPISKKSKYVCFTPKTYVFGITCDRALTYVLACHLYIWTPVPKTINTLRTPSINQTAYGLRTENL